MSPQPTKEDLKARFLNSWAAIFNFPPSWPSIRAIFHYYCNQFEPVSLGIIKIPLNLRNLIANNSLKSFLLNHRVVNEPTIKCSRLLISFHFKYKPSLSLSINYIICSNLVHLIVKQFRACSRTTWLALFIPYIINIYND